MPRRFRFLALPGVACALLLAAASAAAAGSGIAITAAGPPQTVFRWAAEACARDDYPDAPARAFRDHRGRVRLFATHWQNRALVGPDLDQVKPDCRVVFRGGEHDDPARFDDRGWLAGFYTLDGRTVYALVHNEFHGHRRPALCPSGRYMDCWYNAITGAVSHDGGASFALMQPEHLVAVPPYRYDSQIGRHSGFFSPTNIVRRPDGFHALIFTEARDSQPRGNCLIRTVRLDDPATWRGFDGTAFTATFASPYRTGDPGPVCRPVGVGVLRWPVTSLAFHRASGRFIALMSGALADKDGEEQPGIYAATSTDLVTWQGPWLVLPAVNPQRYRCGGPPPIAYPSLLDPDSPTINFETVDGAAFVYATRFNPTGCALKADRDLVRFPVYVKSQ